VIRLRLTCFGTAKTVTSTAAIVYTLIQTGKLSGVDPQARFADTLGRIAELRSTPLD